MKKKHTLRLWSFDYFQFEQVETWLMDMGAAGWQIESSWGNFVQFQNCEPAAIRYRCVPDVFDSVLVRQRMVEEWQQAGWKLIGSLHHLYIFAEPDGDEVPEMRCVPSELARLLQKRLRVRIIGHSILISVLAFIVAWMLFSVPSAWAVLYFFPLIILMGIFGVYMFRSFKSVHHQIDQLLQGEQLTHRKPYHVTVLLSRAMFIVNLCFWVFAFFWNVFGLWR